MEQFLSEMLDGHNHETIDQFLFINQQNTDQPTVIQLVTHLFMVLPLKTFQKLSTERLSTMNE